MDQIDLNTLFSIKRQTDETVWPNDRALSRECFQNVRIGIFETLMWPVFEAEKDFINEF